MRPLTLVACLVPCLFLAVQAAPPASLSPHSPPDEGYLPDSEGAFTLHPAPESQKPSPSLRQAEYLRQHHDTLMATAYLESIVERTDLTPGNRAQVVLELADCLNLEKRKADSLSWLKIWLQLYPGRPEVGAVAYRLGTLYTELGLSGPARDAYYRALSSAINQGQVINAGDLDQYSRLTSATLWALADNEYRDGQWERSAKLFDRYVKEATTATPSHLEKAAFLQADCLYQLRKMEPATSAYELALQKHPFNPLAPSARLRLYHLYVMQNKPALAQGELQALIWSVRTAWPQDEAYWQEQTAETLLALNQHNTGVLPALVAKSNRLPAQDKSWQMQLAHYDRVASFRACLPPKTTDVFPPTVSSAPSFATAEQGDLANMQREIDELGPSLSSRANP